MTLPSFRRRRRNTTTVGVSNQIPNRPIVSIGSLTSSGFTVTGSAFSDPDVGDTHAATQWRITRVSDSVIVYNPGDDTVNKTSLAWSGGAASTSYTAEARYKDSAGNYSGWSDPATGTTAAVASTTVYGSDAFTGSDATILRSHTPVAVGSNPAGTAWTDINGAHNNVQLLGNRVAQVGLTGGIVAMSAAATPSLNQAVHADLVFFTNIDALSIGATGRQSGGGGFGGYALEFLSSTTGNCSFQIRRRTDAFVTTSLGSYTFAFPTSGTVVHIELRCVTNGSGCDLSAYVNGALVIGPVTDATPLTGVGTAVVLNSPSGGATATTGVHLDNLVQQSYP